MKWLIPLILTLVFTPHKVSSQHTLVRHPWASLVSHSSKDWLTQQWPKYKSAFTPVETPVNGAAENLIIITTDGLRWQEVFQGADPDILEAIGKKRFYANQVDNAILTFAADRSALMPFFWSELAQNGQIYGNRSYQNHVNVTNHSHISYPGYAELLCGFADDRHIKLNTKKVNPNSTMLDWMNAQPAYCGQVAAFASWDVFPFILNRPRAAYPINAAFEPLDESALPDAPDLNRQLLQSKKPWRKRVRPDTLTWAFARHYASAKHPKVLYIGLGETDEYAHDNNYTGYLGAIRQFDQILSEIWAFIQEDPFYRNKTALFITTDHGRGREKWQSHHPLNPGSDEIWLAIAAPGIIPTGEIKSPGEIRQCQLANTMTSLLGFRFSPVDHTVAAMSPIARIMLQQHVQKQAK